MASVLDDLKFAGSEALEALVAEGREETLRLEFKRISDPGAETLSRDDRKRIARAVCGMANAEGGTVIIGVASRKVDGLDVADTLVPMAKAASLRGRLASALPEMLGPQHTGVAVEFIPVGPDSEAGLLVVEVPPSNLRPHMSMMEQRYFRRGSQGTCVMLHGEVRDLMLSMREGVLEMTVGARRGTIIGGRTFFLDVVIGLRNIGRVPIKAPYLRLVGVPTAIHPEALAQGFVAKNRGTEGSIYVAGAGTILHVDDEVNVATIASGIHFGDLGASSPWDHVAAVGAGSVEERFKIGNFAAVDRDQFRSVPEQSFELSASFGAENAQALRLDPRFFGRPELFRLFRNLIR